MANDAKAKLDEAVAAFERSLTAGAESELQPIGVPAGYSAERPAPAPYARDMTQQVPARYFDGDDWAPASLPGPRIAELQRQMVAAGLIPRGASYRNGVWDDVSRSAYRQLLGEANGSGLSAEQQVKVRQNAPKANQPEFQAPVRLKRDPAAIRSSVRALMADVIGPDRKPTDEELNELTGVLERIDSQAYDQSTAASQAQFDREMAAENGAPVGAAPVVQDVDPDARFEELLRERYKPEIQMREGVTDLATGRENLLGNIFAIDQMIGA